ncbi:DNA polymerase epsilon subunit 2 [Lingula anatina]|uniref:DNA polymerase epsilon subunit n=1 Tax=Lingula anatina TaxID=7574 RepID=A0A1S3HPG0_LINAN|nr:DNA polymerase epsilon subunit 2 [Lingula anatina]|eukprot:XP_013387927.1 DNA polymerase epsilon subunit 2 [Lingula anatina]
MAAKLKSQISSAFKMHGLTLRSDATKYLIEVLTPISEAERENGLDKILEILQKQLLSSTMVSRDVCEAAVQECNQEQEEDSDRVFTVIDAFSVPQYSYSYERKKFLLNSNLGLPPPCLHSDAEAKCSLYRDRYTLLHQRTSRHDLFTPPALGAQQEQHSKKFKLRPVEFLLGSTAKLGDIIVLGMLTQLKEGKWFLEDTTGAVQLDLTKANFHTGLFTENCFVLAEGWYDDSIFHVNAFGFPPPEPSKTTRAYFGNINFFGGPSATSLKMSPKLQQIEQENQDAMFVIVSDVWLDSVKVLERLRLMFVGYAEMPPTCFIFCGNFTSSTGTKNIKTLQESFRSLADILKEFPSLVENSRFLFVPGPQDPGPANILPRPALPNVVTEEFRRRVPSAIFASNPCRLQYCTQEIVVFREDIVTKMCRNCVKFPADGDIPTHFAKTIISQGHLCPLPLHVCPVYWSYDSALRVYPLPDVVITADKYDPFMVSQVDCTVINPGSFPRSDFSFKVYFPASRQVEESRIDID